jgi:hypothetical protein
MVVVATAKGCLAAKTLHTCIDAPVHHVKLQKKMAVGCGDASYVNTVGVKTFCLLSFFPLLIFFVVF